MRRFDHDDHECGAYLILYALLAVVFFTIAAILLDIAGLRQGRRADRAAADLSVTAAVAELDANDPASFARACDDAWGYVLANRTEASGTISPPNCAATFPATDACTGTMPARTATATIATLTISIVHPVPDSSPLMRAETPGGDTAQPVDPANDGSPCERIAVRIVRTRTFLFAQVAGTFGGTTDVHSVARALTTTSATEVPAIVAVEPSACRALVTEPGAGSLLLGSASQAGLAIVDSDASGGTCGGGNHAIAAGAAGDPADRIRAQTAGSATGQIRSYALAGANFANAYDAGAVGAGRLHPQPTPALTRTGRALIDNRYRCSTCPGGSDVIGPLEVQRSATPPVGATATVGGAACTVPPAGGGQFSALHVYVDCDPFVVQGSVTFLGQSATIRGSVIVEDGGCLAVNDSTCGGTGIVAQDADIYVRGGLSKATKGQLALPRTFVYIGGALNIGVDADTTIGNSTLTWTAPIGGSFEDLLFWTEFTGPIVLGEQKNTTLVGTFHAPRADVTINPRNGGGVTAPLQIVARTVRLAGLGTYRLQPTPDRATGAFTRQVRLIR